MSDKSLLELSHINDLAHVNTFHPNALRWSHVRDSEELEFLSYFCFEDGEHQREAIAYLTKEFAQLAELERHVSATMSLIAAEFQGSEAGLAAGFDLNHALSCFSAEEIQHSNTFYRWVRELSQSDVKLADNLFAERLAVYQRDVSPEVKLAALCASIYVGESVTVVFENRAKFMDRRRCSVFSELLYLHGLDEDRHIQVDHFVIEKVIPSLSAQEYDSMLSLLHDHVALNQELGARFTNTVREKLGVDWTADNLALEVETLLFQSFESSVYGPNRISTVDASISDSVRDVIQRFCGNRYVHA